MWLDGAITHYGEHLQPKSGTKLLYKLVLLPASKLSYDRSECQSSLRKRKRKHHRRSPFAGSLLHRHWLARRSSAQLPKKGPHRDSEEVHDKFPRILRGLPEPIADVLCGASSPLPM